MKITYKTVRGLRSGSITRRIFADGYQVATAEEAGDAWHLTVNDSSGNHTHARNVAADFEDIRELVREYCEKDTIRKDLTFIYLGFTACVRPESKEGEQILFDQGFEPVKGGELPVETGQAQAIEEAALQKGLWVFKDEKEAVLRTAAEMKRAQVAEDLSFSP